MISKYGILTLFIRGLFIVWHLGKARHCLNLSQTETETSLYDQPKQRDGKKQTEADRRKIENTREEEEKRERARARDPGSLQSPVIIPRSQNIHGLLMIQAAAMSIFTV